jgi:phospholipase C
MEAVQRSGRRLIGALRSEPTHRFGVAFVVVVIVAMSGCSATGTPRSSTTSSNGTATSSSSPDATAGQPGGALQHVVIIMDENKPSSAVLGNAAAPYLNDLASQYAQATDYSGVAHPSLPNYLALTSGGTDGITTDCNPPGGHCIAAVTNIGDEITASGRTWKMYAESMPAPCSPYNAGDYAVKHNPFLYYPAVTRSASYCAGHDVPYSQFATDLATTRSLPSYSYVSPNLCDDMHNCSVGVGDAWLSNNVPQILRSPAFTTQRSLLVITFDEGDSSNNVVPCIFAGTAARRGYVSATSFSHYSLLRTIEAEWGLKPMTANDAAASPMTAMLTR